MTTNAEWVLENSALCIRRGNSTFVPNALDIFRSVEELQPVWPDLPPGRSGAAETLKFSHYPASLRLVIERREGAEGLTLRLVGKTGGTAFDIPELPANRDHLVFGGTWYSIDTEESDRIADVLRSVDTKLGELSSLRAFLKLRQEAQNGGPIEDRTADAPLPPMLFVPAKGMSPKGVNATLYGYQDDGWRWLKFMASQHMGGILADEMGLGKTLQVISLLSDAGPDRPTVAPALIVAPGSLLENWKRELTKFAPGLSVIKHHGSKRTGRPQELTDFNVVITSYDTVVRDSGMFGMIDWKLVVLDEAQYIRNPGAIRTRAAKALRRETSLAVTGTPMENRLSDLWSLIDFAVPGHLGTLNDFTSTFEDSVDGAIQLENLISPVILRRRVRDVAADLPERIDIPQAIEMNQDESAAYEEMRKDIFSRHGAAANLVALTSLRMFCAHPSLVTDGAAAQDFSKLERLHDILEEIFASGEKVIIFTSYTAMADRIAGLVASQWNIFAECLDGRTPIDDRQSLIDRFSEVDGAAALILNPKAGGAGLNITAANHVVHYNLEWNPALEDQASARSHRRGQTLPVTVHRLYCAGTVEEVVNERSMRKRDLAAAAIVGVTGQDEDYIDILHALERSPIRT